MFTYGILFRYLFMSYLVLILQVIFASLTTYVLVDATHTLTAEKIFVSVSLLNILRVPLGLLPIIIAYTVQVIFEGWPGKHLY